MQEGKFLKLIIVCLLMLNLGTLGYLWLNHGHSRHNGMRPESAAELLNRELKLSSTQEQQYRGMRDVHHALVIAITKDVESMQHRLYETLSVSPADTVRATAIIDSMVTDQRVMYLATYQHFHELRNICTPEQQRRFDEVIQDALNKISELRGKRPPPREE